MPETADIPKGLLPLELNEALEHIGCKMIHQFLEKHIDYRERLPVSLRTNFDEFRNWVLADPAELQLLDLPLPLYLCLRRRGYKQPAEVRADAIYLWGTKDHPDIKPVGEGNQLILRELMLI